MKRNSILAAITLLFISGSILYSQKIVDPQVLAHMEEQRRKADESGYADIEIDNLHREIAKYLTIAKVKLKKEDDGAYIIPIAQGESVKSVSERHLFNGIIKIYASESKEADKLTRIVLTFVRNNPIGREFKEEKRSIENPSPNYPNEPAVISSTADNKAPANEQQPQIDKNEDIILVFAESEIDPKAPLEKLNYEPAADPDKKTYFVEKGKFILKDIRFFDKKMSVIETYKKYLRKTRKVLMAKAHDVELNERVRIKYMLELK